MEICVDNLQSAVNAEEGGASRLELCSALSEGGLTPTPGMLVEIKKVVSIPVYSMLRPRRGMDFVYSKEEIEMIKHDAICLKQAGADGFVFGALKNDATIDVEACKEILHIISPLPATFHRAFDVTSDPFDSLKILIQLGFLRVLTSGQAASAVDGISIIRDLISFAENKIIVMPGAGINPDNVRKIVLETRAKEIHGSCRSVLNLHMRKHKINCNMGSSDLDCSLLVTDPVTVKQLVTVLNSIL